MRRSQRFAFLLRVLGFPEFFCHQQPHAFKDLLIRLFGSFAVFDDVSFFFMPDILAQNDLWRGLSESLLGAFRFMPWALAEARPLAFNPPEGFLPSLRCHAGVFAMSVIRMF